jgi:hypothetical protein
MAHLTFTFQVKSLIYKNLSHIHNVKQPQIASLEPFAKPLYQTRRLWAWLALIPALQRSTRVNEGQTFAN